jgi:hypothetical protein
MTISEQLDRHYNLFANENAPLGFFSGLWNYTSFIFETPELKKIVDREIRKRDALYKKVDDLEEKSIEEMRDVKKKLLSIIEKYAIDPKSLTVRWSIIPMPRGEQSLLDEMEAFDGGNGISISGFHSDNLQHYLFDIAANLLYLGYEKDLKPFIFSNEDYGEYYRDVIGNEDWVIERNKKGNFIFSKTWPIRIKLIRDTENARRFDPWGTFEAILIFRKGWEAARENRSWEDITNTEMPSINARGIVDIVHAVQDLRELMNKAHPQFMMPNLSHLDGPNFLKLPIFKTYIATMHGFLLQHMVAEVMSEQGQLGSIRFDSQNGVLRFGDVSHTFHKSTDDERARLSLFRKLWDEKLVINDGGATTNGEAFPPSALAVQLGITNTPRDFEQDKSIRVKFYSMVRGINRLLREKGFPAHVERMSGIQLIIDQ